MKTILWVSRHDPLLTQIRELKRIYGEDCKIVMDKQMFKDAKEIVQKYKQLEADDLVLVAPLSVCRAICSLGIYPLWAEMRRTDSDHSEVKASGIREKISGEDTYYKFIKFYRLKGIELKLEAL